MSKLTKYPCYRCKGPSFFRTIEERRIHACRVHPEAKGYCAFIPIASSLVKPTSPDNGATRIPCLVGNERRRRWNESTRQLEWQARSSGSKSRGDGVTSTIPQCHHKLEPQSEREKLVSYWKKTGRREVESLQVIMKQLRDKLQDARDRAKGESLPQLEKGSNDTLSKIKSQKTVAERNAEFTTDNGATRIPCLVGKERRRRWNGSTRQLESQAKSSGSMSRGDGVTSTIPQCHHKLEPQSEREKLVAYWKKTGRREIESLQVIMKQLRDKLQGVRDRAKEESQPQDKERSNDTLSKIKSRKTVAERNVEFTTDNDVTRIPCLVAKERQRRWNESTRQLEWQAGSSGSEPRGDRVTSTIPQCHHKRESPRQGEKLISYWQKRGRRGKENTQALMKQLRDKLQDARDRAKRESQPQDKERSNDTSSKIINREAVSKRNFELTTEQCGRENDTRKQFDGQIQNHRQSDRRRFNKESKRESRVFDFDEDKYHKNEERSIEDYSMNETENELNRDRKVAAKERHYQEEVKRLFQELSMKETENAIKEEEINKLQSQNKMVMNNTAELLEEKESLLQEVHDHSENEKALVASLENARKILENEQKEKRACEKESKKRKNEMKKLNLLVHRLEKEIKDLESTKEDEDSKMKLDFQEIQDENALLKSKMEALEIELESKNMTIKEKEQLHKQQQQQKIKKQQQQQIEQQQQQNDYEAVMHTKKELEVELATVYKNLLIAQEKQEKQEKQQHQQQKQHKKQQQQQQDDHKKLLKITQQLEFELMSVNQDFKESREIWEKKVKDLEKTISDQAKKLEKEYAVEFEIEEIRGYYESVKDDFEKKKDQIQSLEEENKTMRSEGERFKRENEKLKERCKSIEEECKILRNKVKEEDGDNVKLLEACERLQAELKSQEMEAERLKTESQIEKSERIKLEGRLKMIKEECKELRDKIKEENDNNKQLLEIYEKFQEDVEEKEKENQTLKSEAGKYQNHYEELTERLRMMEEECEELRNKVDVEVNRSEELLEAYEESQKEIKRKEHDMQELKYDKRIRGPDILRLEEKLKMFEDENEVMKISVQNEEGVNKQLLELCEDLQKENRYKENDVMVMKSEFEKSKQDAKGLQDSFRLLKEEYEGLQLKMKEKDKEKRVLLGICEKLNEDLKVNEEQLIKLEQRKNSERDIFETKIKDLEADKHIAEEQRNHLRRVASEKESLIVLENDQLIRDRTDFNKPETKRFKVKKMDVELGPEESNDTQNGKQMIKKRIHKRRMRKVSMKKDSGSEELDNQLQRPSSDVFLLSPISSLTRPRSFTFSKLPPLPSIKKISLTSFPTEEID